MCTRSLETDSPWEDAYNVRGLGTLRDEPHYAETYSSLQGTRVLVER